MYQTLFIKKGLNTIKVATPDTDVILSDTGVKRNHCNGDRNQLLRTGKGLSQTLSKAIVKAPVPQSHRAEGRGYERI